MRSRCVLAAATVVATVAVTSNLVVAQISKEWRQCSGGEGPIADIVISGCSAVIQASQDSPKRLATAFNNRGVAYKFKGEYDHALEDYDRAIRLNPSFANAYNRVLDLPHCDAAQRSRQREKSRQVRDLKECCSGDTQCRRNVPFLPPEGKSRVAARARRPMTAPAGDESGREANTRANRPLQVAGGPNTAL